MTLAKYFENIENNISNIKKKILERLWSEGAVFPRGWVSSSELLAITGQKYFDRRIRELRDQNGCDIETEVIHGEHSYRLSSQNICQANPRAYLTESQKRKLFESRSNRCSICGLQFQSGIRGLQADHKIPLNRSGSHDLSNWQPMCVSCNVSKRRACAGCKLDCHSCPWAFPDRFGQKIVTFISFEMFDLLKLHMDTSGKSIEVCAGEAFAQYLSKNR